MSEVKVKISKSMFFAYPIVVFFGILLLIGAATNFDRLILGEKPEITGASGDTISNVSNGQWRIGGGVSTDSIMNFGSIYSGIGYFDSVRGLYDSIIIVGLDTSISSGYKFFAQWRDSLTIGLNAPGDSALPIYPKFRNNDVGSDTLVVMVPVNPLPNADTIWYNWLIIK